MEICRGKTLQDEEALTKFAGQMVKMTIPPATIRWRSGHNAPATAIGSKAG
jgi:hypothetical protein